IMAIGWGGGDVNIFKILIYWFSYISIELFLIISSFNLFRKKIIGVFIGISLCSSLLICTLIDYISSNFWSTREFKYFYSFEFLIGSVFPIFYLIILLL